MSQEIHKELIQKLLQGEISEQESMQLDELIKSDENAKTYLEKMKKLYSITDLQKEFSDNLNIDKSFESFLKERDLDEEPKVIPITPAHSPWKTLLKVAAVLVVGLGIGYFFFEEEQPVEILVTDSSETEKVELDLADRTSVILNVRSKISYPPAFGGDKRIVKLEGEAFFDVETDSTKPFVIHVGDGRIEVKGTSFNVNANNPDSIVVTVKEGAVQFYHEGSNQYELLTADETGTLMASSDVVVKAANNNDNYLYWYDGVLWFKNTSLKNVVTKLNKKWNIDIHIADEAVEDCPVTASFTSEEVEKILRLLEMTLDISVEVKDEKFVISGEGC